MNTPQQYTTENTTLLQLDKLGVQFSTPDGIVDAVRQVSLDIKARECLGIVGESGSGKSQTMLAAMGLLAANGTTTGKVLFDGEDLLSLPIDKLNRVRGERISMIFQDPLTSLTPHLRIGDQMREVLFSHQGLSGAVANQRCLEWLDHVHIPNAKQRLRQYPHELSGGMRQRVMIAMAMLCGPELLIADEPTTALDVTIQAEILDLMDELRREQHTAIVIITHDMGVVARLCDQVHVMKAGQFVESGSVDTIFHQPADAYTQMLLAAVPRVDAIAEKPAINPDAESLLQVDDVHVQFSLRTSLFKRAQILRAVDGVSFDLVSGETLGIVGESGSGKSTLARAVLKLLDTTDGRISWLGNSIDGLDEEGFKPYRRDMQIVFQDPLASLNPARTIGNSIMEPLGVFDPGLSSAEKRQRVQDMMQRVGLEPTLINRYPHELSGGQNQRVGIARAMILRPRLVVCDEAVSALDVSVQAQVMALLKDLQQEFGLTYLFITHDLSVVRALAHRILVLYLGRIVELADTDELFDNPQHPYTRALLSAAPIPDPRLEQQRQRIKLGGAPSPLRFLPSRAAGGNDQYLPELQERSPGHWVAEHDPLEQLLA